MILVKSRQYVALYNQYYDFYQYSVVFVILEYQAASRPYILGLWPSIRPLHGPQPLAIIKIS